MIHLLKPGLLTTVQDAGRRGSQRFGLSVGGAADPFALRVANALVGNDAKAAGLEFILAGPRLHFDNDTLVAWCGAEFEATLDHQPLPKNRPVHVPPGGCLDFAGPKNGTSAWLAVGGGIVVPEVMGSRSTDRIAGIGGVGGRPLIAGDVLPVGPPSARTEATLRILKSTKSAAAWSLPPERLGLPEEPGVLRLMRGPEWNWFSAEAQEELFAESYRVTPESNRMGLRLAGPALARQIRREMISTAVDHGVMQVPPAGQPILLGADRQTIGGYPRIAVLATVDFGRLAQARPGDALRFREITLAQAHRLLGQRERDFVLAVETVASRIGCS